MYPEKDLPSPRHRLMRTASGQPFFCKLPPLSSATPPVFKTPVNSLVDPIQTDASEFERKQERQNIEAAGLKKGLELLSSLKDRCLYIRMGWFTYSFCYGKGEIRQFHAMTIPGHNHPHEDPTQDVYVLGFHLSHPQNPYYQARLDGTLPEPTVLAGSGQLTSLRKTRFSSSAGPTMGLSDVLREEAVIKSDTLKEEEDFEDKRYLVQRWDGGTICDMTGKPRSVEVQYHCSTIATDHIALLRETSICEYLVVIHTPSLCSEPLFLDGGGRKSLNGVDDSGVIECRPVLTDEEFEKWKAQEAAKDRKRVQSEISAQQASNEAPLPADNQPSLSGAALTGGHVTPQTGDAKGDASSLQQDHVHRPEQNQPSLSEPVKVHDQDGSTSPTSSSDEVKASGSSDGARKASDSPSDSSDKHVKKSRQDPLTVFYDADTGEVYMDDPSYDTQKKRGKGSKASLKTQASETDRNRWGENNDYEEGDDITSLEDLTRALKDSLGALLRDLRENEAGNGRAPRVPPQHTDAEPLSEFMAALKEAGIPATHAKLRLSKLPTNPASQPNGPPSKVSQKRMTDEHAKMLEMYGSKFDSSETDVEEENKEEKR